MAQTIDKRVGKGSFLPMSDANVQKVTELLNMVPADHGGSAGALKPPVKRDRLEQAICDFQAFQFGQVTGFIDPENVTIRRLEVYAAGDRPGPDGVAFQFKAARQYIVEQAKTMVGMVSNQQVDQKTHERHGWRELWEIFYAAGIPVETQEEYEHRKSLPKFTLPAGKKLPFDHFKYVRRATPGMAWCGIFATWALNRAGFNFKWVTNKGIRHQDGSPLPLTGPVGITLGDVCVVNDKHVAERETSEEFGLNLFGQHLSHHIIVTSHPTLQGTIDVIEGNYPHQQLGAHSIVDDNTRMPLGKRNIREIIHRYTLFQPLTL
jgi:hypothetical protein